MSLQNIYDKQEHFIPHLPTFSPTAFSHTYQHVGNNIF